MIDNQRYTLPEGAPNRLWFVCKWFGALLIIWFWGKEYRIRINNPFHPVTKGYKMRFWKMAWIDIYTWIIRVLMRHGFYWQADCGVLPLRTRHVNKSIAYPYDKPIKTWWHIRPCLWSILGILAYKCMKRVRW